MKKKLINNATTKKYLASLPVIYLVGFWARYGVMEFPLAGWTKEDGQMVPLVYDYFDGNGMYDEYRLTSSKYTTTGAILFWTTNGHVANMVADLLNGKKEQ